MALEQLFPDETTEYAEEGTAAHALAELELRLAILGDDHVEHWEFTDLELEMQTKGFDSKEIHYYIEQYLDYCKELYDQSKLQHLLTFADIEARLDFSKYVPQGFGTGDFLLIAGTTLHIIDLKYGKGVPVKAPGNPQIRLYGLGAIELYGLIFDIETVKMHIFQPRINNISIETMSRKDLEDWGNTSVMKRAQMAYDNCGTFEPGDHCQFCKARATCKARAQRMIQIIQNILGGQ